MKYNFTKISSLMLSLFLVFTACETEESLDITSPDSVFQLQEPGISNIFLNFALPDNPAFTIAWNDEVTGADSYTIEMATDPEFSSPMTIGNSSMKTFTMNVSDFNAILAGAGISSFSSSPVYMRILAGSNTSNTVLFIVNTYPENNPVITAPGSDFSIVLLEESVDDEAITIEWNDPDFGNNSSATIAYEVESAVSNTDFAGIIPLGDGENISSLTLTQGQLNGAGLNLGFQPEEEGAMDIRIKSTIETTSGTIERFSETLTIAVTPFANISPVSWGVIGSGYNNWGAGTDGTFYSTSTANVIVTYLALLDGEIKFRENNDWGSNLGDNGADGTLEDGGANIAVTAGRYKIEINLNDNTYTIEPFTWGVVGSAYNDWGASPDAPFSYDYTTDTFKLGVVLLDGEMKFRFNNDWGLNLGDDGADGTLEEGGANIVATAGHYAISLDRVNNTYLINSANLWGVVGSAYNDWGASPDFTFTEVNQGIWLAEGVDLIAGEMKFRINNDWGVNIGDDGADGTFEDGGANIVITEAGKYRIMLNTNDSTYTLVKIQ